MVAEINVTDPGAYRGYVAAVAPVIAEFGGKYLLRGGQTVSVESAAPLDIEVRWRRGARPRRELVPKREIK